ncbi:BadF/BadG/BcrA/BcrD ATPase family protein [Cyanobium sp. NIES-981]|uniref:BadF/BadG/BcrA/BcrD ATPase family protein n=1 Tax=Cyanobium sp. NIES-981 TaxID=1851505 RepID=UPI0007DCD2AB|nr:BadF/BadG/BcrA/BcrD ATPase family protein [Cyanobium sp. NIES-981]SBO43647.1 BadF/BadG/BcrA/BcrD ATPase family superfamily [Cyanobium sp. NIES-981]
MAAPIPVIAGFDAGQTHTTCRLALCPPGGGCIQLAEGEGPGVRHLQAPGGPAAFHEALSASLAVALAACPAAVAATGLSAAAIGASGIEVGSAVQEQGRRLAAEILALPLERVEVTGDERTALRGAMGEAAEGLVLISGTGTIAVGRNRHGREHRCAGWGWLLDGAGSAMDIGRDGLTASLAMADGREPETALRHQLWSALGLDPAAAGSPQAIKALVVQPDFGPAGFAALAPVVAAAAAAGDAAALAIVQRQAGALAAMAATIARELQLEPATIWPMGGVLEHLAVVRQHLALALRATLPTAALRAAAGDACAGALALAAERLP